MTATLELGDILEIGKNKRLVYLGDGVANCETNLSVSGWKVDPYYPAHANVKLTEAQIAHWLTKKSGN